MNIPKLFEGAIAETLRQHALDVLPRMRTWQNVSDEYRWSPTNDRSFPLLDIRATPPVTGEDGCTQACNISILVATNAADDPSHVSIARIYECVQTILDALYSQFRTSSTGDERATFDRYIADADPAANALISVGGFTHGDPMTPYEDAGANFVGLNFVIHFSRSDY